MQPAHPAIPQMGYWPQDSWLTDVSPHGMSIGAIGLSGYAAMRGL